MKLELKHLAPYLPYNLKLIFESKGGRVVEVTGLRTAFNILKDKRLIFFNTTTDTLSINYFKPILKSISDLENLVTKEFKIYDKNDGSNYSKEIIDLFCYENINHLNISECDFQKLPYECIEFMFRNHYDLFGLISQGLALSIHDVE